jgi:hypothetical protein
MATRLLSSTIQHATYKSVDCRVASRERFPAWKGISSGPWAAICGPTGGTRLSQKAFADVLGVPGPIWGPSSEGNAI